MWRLASIGIAALSAAALGGGVSYEEDFNAYEAGVSLCNFGGWEGFDEDPDACENVFVVDDPDGQGGLSLEINGHFTDDVVQRFDTIRNDLGVEGIRLTAMTYAPSGFVGTRYFILLNTYAVPGPKNWSAQILFDGDDGRVCDDSGFPLGSCDGVESVPLIRNQWVQLRFDIDLRPEGNTQSVFYNDQLLLASSWTEHLGGGGQLALEAIDLFSNSGDNPMYFDDLEIVELTACGPADLDGSGAVDFGDILAILTAWGNPGGPEDLDDSGAVDFGDILVVLSGWGPCV